MSTASPLPLPSATLAEIDANRRKREVAARLLEHRARRPRTPGQENLPLVERAAPARAHRVADSVAARFAQRESYRDFLAQEAEKSIRQAEAAAAVAQRNAQAISEAQQELLGEIEDWKQGESDAGNVEVETCAAPASAFAAPPMACSPTFAVVEDVFTSPEENDGQSTTSLRVNSLSLPEPAEPPVPIPGNLLEFPRQLIAARKARPRLAEGPLREETDAAPERAQLRIFEVDARTISTEPVVETPTPEWASIRLDGTLPQRDLNGADAPVSFAIPIQSAPLSRRFMAAAVDGCCIVTAFLLAVTAAAYTLPELPGGLPAIVAAAGTLLVLFLVYQLLFFTVCDATPGMRYARIGLCTFADENPSRRAMRRRVLAVVLAGVPVGLGFVWACLDDEKLGWHDRISRMYQRAY